MIPAWEALTEGQALPPLRKGPIERLQLVQYAGASGDFNRIHVEEGYAKEAGYPSVFAHGMLTMAFFGQLLTDGLGGPAPLRKLTCRFRAITWPGDVITCSAKVVAKRTDEKGANLLELALAAKNQEGVLTADGTATIVVI